MGTLKCTIVVNKNEGISLVVVDPEAGSTQTVHLGRDSIVTTVAGSAATSTVTQTAESFSVECKNFEVKANKIVCQSVQDSTYEATGNLKVSAKNKTTVEGSTVQVDGLQTNVTAQGMLKLEATGPASLQGAIVKISAPLAIG